MIDKPEKLLQFWKKKKKKEKASQFYDVSEVVEVWWHTFFQWITIKPTEWIH